MVVTEGACYSAAAQRRASGAFRVAQRCKTSTLLQFNRARTALKAGKKAAKARREWLVCLTRR